MAGWHNIMMTVTMAWSWCGMTVAPGMGTMAWGSYSTTALAAAHERS